MHPGEGAEDEEKEQKEQKGQEDYHQVAPRTGGQ